MQTIQGDNRCQELWHLLQEIRKQDNVTLDDIISYRREAERHVGSDDHLYKIDCVSVSVGRCVDAVLKLLRTGSGLENVTNTACKR